MNFELDDLSKNKGPSSNYFGVDFDFKSKNFSTNNLLINSEKGDSRLRLDVGEVNINSFDLESSFKECIKEYITNNVDLVSEDNSRYIFNEIDNKACDVDKIINLIETESIARIKRSLGTIYLEYLLQNSGGDSKSLENYTKRFYILEEYIQKLSEENSSKNKFKVKDNKGRIFETTIDAILSQGNAFDELPVVAKFDKSLEEKAEKEGKIYKFDLKFKLNGKVHSEGVASLDYMLLNIKNGEFDGIRVVRIAFLLIFLLNDLENNAYNPVENWENIFNEHKGNLHQAVKSIILGLENNIKNNTKKLLSDMLKNIKKKSELLKPLEFERYVVVDKQLLDDSEDSIFENDFYDEQIAGKIFKEYDEFYGSKTIRLKHLAIVKNFDKEKYLYSYPIKISISSTGISTGISKDSTKINYEIQDKKTVNIAFIPTAHLRNGKYNERNKNIRGVVEDEEYTKYKNSYYKKTLEEIRARDENGEMKSSIILSFIIY